MRGASVDELLMMRLSGGVLGWGIDGVSIFAFFAIAFIYWLSPVVGYRFERRGSILAALYLLVIYGVLALLQLMVSFVMILDKTAFGRTDETLILFGFAILKLLAFCVAMLNFVMGLQSLRLRGSGRDFEL